MRLSPDVSIDDRQLSEKTPCSLTVHGPVSKVERFAHLLALAGKVLLQPAGEVAHGAVDMELKGQHAVHREVLCDGLLDAGMLHRVGFTEDVVEDLVADFGTTDAVPFGLMKRQDDRQLAQPLGL